jgi:GDPmannose 4,6-dehydratase
MLQQAKPEDLVIATGEQHTVREFVVAAATELGVRIRWRGKGPKERGYDQEGRCIVAVDPNYFRPTEVDSLLGDARKARRKLGWKPRIRFAELVTEMVRADLEEAEREQFALRHGYAAATAHE